MANQTSQPAQNAERSPHCVALYANTVGFENSFWDLRLLLGQLDQSSGSARNVVHATLNVPWAQAKLMAYFVQANVLLYESDHGPIELRRDTLPPDPTSLVNLSELPPNVRKTIEKLKAQYDAFMAGVKVVG